jgi:spoIIIJ-associated protein
MTVEEFITQTLAHMGIDDPKVETIVAENVTTITVLVSEEDSGLLIGRHGETIESLQRIVRLIYQKDATTPITLNVNDFREQREEHVREVARRVAERVLQTGQPQILRLPASERRIVHMELANHPEVTTDSEGEGANRVLFVKPKAA